ncbi:hypothetical protein KEM60_02319 [Austwickia sp. TVS 96-490-7B]|uniref:hypothetical protein n=1 Tax=Austwickia sp. TVS 96-490-7B TaxID=2830843 RepID=UPI001C587FE9|nr:hypothetical protein [Austwickia sp. TVS 96-490-7B]MBW3086108.1 hypothetical protein [Austwickia sp. TVS 96-490-7B]
MTNAPGHDRTPDDAEIDAAFAAIVAGWERDAPVVKNTGDTTRANSTEAHPPRPSSSDDPSGKPSRRPSFQVAPPQWRVPPAETNPLAWLGDDFVEPDPPLPRADPTFWYAISAMVFGSLFFVIWAMTGPHTTTMPLLVSAAAAFGGFAVLVARMPDRRDEDDDGARV